MGLYMGSIKVAANIGETISAHVINQVKSITPTTSVQTITPDPGYTGMNQVTVNAIPSSYIIPSGTLNIYADGINSNASAYDQINVDTTSHFENFIANNRYDNWWSSNRNIENNNITKVGIGKMASLMGVNGCRVSTINLPNCSTIDAYAFANNPSLISISLPSLSSITGPGAFYYCSSLSEISLPLLSIGSGNYVPSCTFSHCIKLTTAIFGSSVKCFPEATFYECRSLNYVQANNVQVIRSSAFYNCSRLSNISFPELVQISGSNAFYNCGITSLTDINFPQLISIAGENAFYNCQSLSIISFSKSMSIGFNNTGSSYVFSAFGPALKNIYIEKINPTNTGKVFWIGGYSCSIDTIDIGFTDTYLTSYLFYLNAPVNYLKIRGITNLGSTAGLSTRPLINAEFPDVTQMSQYTFYACHSLTSISLPELQTVASLAFMNCSNLTNVYMPKCSYINYYAFSGCRNLQNIDLPSVKTISTNVFMSCSNLTNISIPMCSIIGGSAFYDCINLSSISLPNVYRIEGLAFYNTPITSLSLPNFYSYYNGAFDHCYQLENIYFGWPSSSGTLSLGIFSTAQPVSSYAISMISGKCYSLAAFSSSWINTYFSNLKTINLDCYSVSQYAFISNNTLENLYLNGISGSGTGAFGLSIGYRAFKDCANLKNISINNIRNIEGNAFENVTANSIYINTASTFARVTGYTFSGCNNLSTITISGSMSSNTQFAAYGFARIPNLYSVTINLPSIVFLETYASTIFLNTPFYSATNYWSGPDPHIYVPASLVDAYKSANYWSQFSSYITAIPAN